MIQMQINQKAKANKQKKNSRRERDREKRKKQWNINSEMTIRLYKQVNCIQVGEEYNRMVKEVLGTGGRRKKRQLC